MHQFTRSALLLGVFLIGLPAWSSPVTIYNNFSENSGSPGYPYVDPVGGYQVSWNQAWMWGDGTIDPYGTQEALSFTVGGSRDLYLDSVSLAMYKWLSGSPLNVRNTMGVNHDNLTVQIVDGTTSGPILEVLAVDPVIAEDGTTFLHLSSTLHPLLRSGHTYFIVALPTRINLSNTGDDAFYAWITNKTGAKWNYTLNQYNPSIPGWQGFGSQTRQYDAPTLQVTGLASLPAPVPEPGTWLGAAGALLLLVSQGVRR